MRFLRRCGVNCTGGDKSVLCLCAGGRPWVLLCAEHSGESGLGACFPCLQVGAFLIQILCLQRTRWPTNGMQGPLTSLWAHSMKQCLVSTVPLPAGPPLAQEPGLRGGPSVFNSFASPAPSTWEVRRQGQWNSIGACK